jgi:beta-1,4-mannosyltransferase
MLAQHTSRLQVLVLPRDSNPYQECLYIPMRDNRTTPVRIRYWNRRPWVGLPSFYPLVLWCRVRGCRVAHVHWLAWDLRLAIPCRAKLSRINSYISLAWMRLLGYRIIWTVHNVLPHETQTDDDAAVAKKLAESASALILHSESIKAPLENLGITMEHAIVIPQGNYVGLYGSRPDRETSRTIVGVRDPGRVVLFFGLIRPYKGIAELIESWTRYATQGTLLIAGPCPDPVLRSTIETGSAEDPSIVSRLDFLPNREVPTYFAASDSVCLPFRATTTSSSALLALSHSRPVIAPRLGALMDLPEEVGYFYSPDQPQGLADALHRFFVSSDEDIRRRSALGLEYASQFRWPIIADQTFGLYSSVALLPPLEKWSEAVSEINE